MAQKRSNKIYGLSIITTLLKNDRILKLTNSEMKKSFYNNFISDNDNSTSNFAHKDLLNNKPDDIWVH